MTLASSVIHANKPLSLHNSYNFKHTEFHTMSCCGKMLSWVLVVWSLLKLSWKLSRNGSLEEVKIQMLSLKAKVSNNALILSGRPGPRSSFTCGASKSDPTIHSKV